ncbi:MAG: VanW family protein [Clostridia bacterium]|nr:VanW family protein [Clostridia bacterium]
MCCAFSVRVPRGVTVNGCDVGGLTVGAAKRLLRRQVADRLKQKELRIFSDERVYGFAYPEIDFVDGFDDVLTGAVKGGEYSAPVHFYLNGAEEIADNICADVYRAPVEPYATFNTDGEPFTYYCGSDGAECDRRKLLDDISFSLNSTDGWDNGCAFADVSICTHALPRRTTAESVRDATVRLCSFTTYFDGDNFDRSANIRLAAQKINGTVLQSGEIFSFNGTVGARTEANGFKQAKIIENGKFVVGYGGGVCQVSTTLYNAALLSGLGIEEYHPHSLQVSYVAPSRDAMVSGNYFDLKFKNNRLTPIYVRVKCTLSSVTCTVYGQSDGYEYSFLSRVEENIPRPPAVVVKGGEDKIISYGRDGLKSEGYLVRRGKDGEECELIRKDKYLAVADVVQQTDAPDGDKPEIIN